MYRPNFFSTASSVEMSASAFCSHSVWKLQAGDASQQVRAEIRGRHAEARP
jgi:hypothetical protein